MITERELIDAAVAAGLVRKVPIGARSLKTRDEAPEPTVYPTGMHGQHRASLSQIEGDFQ